MKNKNKNLKEKAISIGIIFLLINLVFLSNVEYVAAQSSSKIGGVANFLKNLIELDNLEPILLIVWLAWMTSSATRNFHTHIREYVFINPDPTNPELLRVMGFFISITQGFYIISIILTGFYLLFISGSARGRAKAKYVLGKLVMGMVLVSISPFLLQLLFQFSSSLTSAILDQGDLDVVTNEYNTIFWRAFEGELYLIFPVLAAHGRNFAVEKLIERLTLHPQKWHEYLNSFLEGVKVGGSAVPLVIYPYFLTVVMLVFTFGFLAFRYLMVMVWSILLPLSIFFTSFELTKNIGRTMMEQTIQWTFFQIFYAIVLVGLSIGLVILPEGYKGYSIFLMDFTSLGVIAIMFFGPWYLSSLIQRLFPP